MIGAVKKKVSAIIGSLFSLGLFGGAMWFLVHALRKYNLEQLLGDLQNLSYERFFAACFFALLAYLFLTFYDVLAFRHIGHPLPYHRIVRASFISFAISNNIGFAVLSGSSLRFRIYSEYGMKALEIVRVIAFCNLTFLLGFLTVGGFALLVLPPPIIEVLSLPFGNLHTLGLIFLWLVSIYLALSASERRQLTIGRWVVTIPVFPLAIKQILAACIDWIATAAIFYMLIPSQLVSFPVFLCIFLAAQFAGITSNVPGGLGVFEGVMLLLMTPLMPEPTIVSAIVVYRLLYFVAPLCIALVLFVIHEMSAGRGPWGALWRQEKK